MKLLEIVAVAIVFYLIIRRPRRNSPGYMMGYYDGYHDARNGRRIGGL